MKIITQYDVGYQFWVPRVINRHTVLTMVLEGVEWNRIQETLEIVARHKQVQRIDLCLEADHEVSVKYYCVNVGQQETQWPRIYDPQEMVFIDEQAALGAARAWRDAHGSEYHGYIEGDDEE